MSRALGTQLAAASQRQYVGLLNTGVTGAFAGFPSGFLSGFYSGLFNAGTGLADFFNVTNQLAG